METIAVDNELEYELQEMYILSNHWQSDITFVQGEIRFLKNALDKYHVYTENLHLSETIRFNKILDIQEASIPGIKLKVSEFLKVIEPFVSSTKKEIGLAELEKFNFLGTEMASLLEYTRLVKRLVFAFIEEAIKTGRYKEITNA